MSNPTAVQPTAKEVRNSLFTSAISVLNLIPRAVGVVIINLESVEIASQAGKHLAQSGKHLAQSVDYWAHEVHTEAQHNHKLKIRELKAERRAAKAKAALPAVPVIP